MKKENKPWTIRDLRDNQNFLEFPEYQREPTVWNLQKKQRLIDSILRDFDIAAIYLFKKREEEYDCIDGRQRINAILSYLGVNESDTDNNFHLNIINEIFVDTDKFVDVNNVEFCQLDEDTKEKILNYQLNVVEIYEVENAKELNLLFLRLQLGSILNAGEKLHAMTGDMRDYIFNIIGGLGFFAGINIPYRRYAKEQIAAQITLNFFSIRENNGEFHRSRYIDLREFFKEHSTLSDVGKERIEEIKQVLNTIQIHFGDNLKSINNRAIAVSVFFFVNELIDQGKESEIDQFLNFFIKFIKTLKWQISKGVRMDEPYYDLLKFQTHVTQAAGEKYAIQNRHEFWREYFDYYKQENKIKGDNEYREATGREADTDR